MVRERQIVTSGNQIARTTRPTASKHGVPIWPLRPEPLV